jgi:type II secretory pathway component PulF
MNEVEVKKFRCTVRRREDPDKVEILIREAATLEAALAALQAKGYLAVAIEPFLEAEGSWAWERRVKPSSSSEIPPVKVQPKKAGETKAPAAAESRIKKKRGFSFPLFTRVGLRDLISFAVQLAALLKAGIPLLNALKIIQRGASKPSFQKILEGLMADVNAGFPFHYAIRRHPRVFPPIWGNLVEVGEVSGTLVDVLEEIARYQEATQHIKGKIISAFFYPAIVLVMVTGALTFLLLVIIPKFKEIFMSLDIELPFLTLLVIGVSDILRNYFPFVILFLVALFFILRLAARSKKGHLAVGLLLLKIPIIGNLNLQVSLVRFARSLGTPNFTVTGYV